MEGCCLCRQWTINMAKNYGIKVMKAGEDVSSNDIRDILFSSKYTMLKYHSDNTTSVEITYGDSSGSAEISHNLGYVPAYIAYDDYGDVGRHLPVKRKTIVDEEIRDSYATSSKIHLRVNYSQDYGILAYSEGGLYNDYYNNNNSVMAGNNGGTTASGAIRFASVNSSAITSAWLNIYVGYKGAGSGNMKIQTFGIDEDDTAAFSGSPMGRSSTTAVNNQDVSVPPVGEYLGIDVKSQVDEIRARPGWSNGSAIGFKIYDNSSPNDVYIHDYGNSYLRLVKDGSVTYYFRVIIFKDRIDF